jgi:hypothetical protein
MASISASDWRWAENLPTTEFLNWPVMAFHSPLSIIWGAGGCMSWGQGIAIFHTTVLSASMSGTWQDWSSTQVHSVRVLSG